MTDPATKENRASLFKKIQTLYSQNSEGISNLLYTIWFISLIFYSLGIILHILITPSLVLRIIGWVPLISSKLAQINWLSSLHSASLSLYFVSVAVFFIVTYLILQNNGMLKRHQLHRATPLVQLYYNCVYLLCAIFLFSIFLLLLGKIGIIAKKMVQFGYFPSPLTISTFFAYAITQTPAVSTVLFLAVGCSNYHAPWSNGKITRHKYFRNESRMKTVRICTYVVCVINMVFAHCNARFAGSSVYMTAAICYSVSLWLCILQSTWRLTFRRTANYAIATANFIIYLTMLDMVCPDDYFLGFISIDRQKLITAFTNIPDLIKNGIIVTIAVALLKDNLSTLLATITSRNPSNLSQRKRRNRRRLLTHWHYNKDSSISALEDSTTILLILEIIVFCFAMIMAFTDSTYTPAFGEKEAVFSPSFSVYPLAIALILFVPAIMATWTVSDEKLIQSEHTYLITKGALLESNDIKDTSSHWLDFTQVLVNLYTNVSGLESEDRGLHKMAAFLHQVHEYVGQNDPCAKSKFFGDILWIKGNINAKLLREAAHEAAADGKELYLGSNMIQRARDVQFASDFHSLIHPKSHDSSTDSVPDQDSGNQTNGAELLDTIDPMQFILKLSNWFFKEHDHAWGQRFSVYNISAHQGIKLLKVDAMIYILQQEGNDHCALAWLGCNCSDRPQSCIENSKEYTADKTISNRMELLLLYPFVVIRCYKNRWNSNAHNILLLEDIVRYYVNVADQCFVSHSEEQLHEVIRSTYRHLLESNADISLLDEIVRMLEATTDDSSLEPNYTSYGNATDDPDYYDNLTQIVSGNIPPHAVPASPNPQPSRSFALKFIKNDRTMTKMADAGILFEKSRITEDGTLTRYAKFASGDGISQSGSSTITAPDKATETAHESLSKLAYKLFADAQNPNWKKPTTEGE